MSTRKEIAALDGADSLQSLDPRLSTAYTTFSVSTHIWEFAAAYFWVFRLSQNELIRTKIDLIFYGLVGLALPPFAVIVCAWPIDSIFRNYSRFVALQYALAVNATAVTVTYFLLAFYSPTRVFFVNGHVHYAYGTSTYVLPFMYGIIAKTTYGIIFALRGDWFGVISEGDTMWLVNITSEFRWLEFKCLGLSVVLTVLFVYSEFKEYASVVSVFFLAYAAGLYYFYSVLKQLYFSRPSLQYEATKTEYLSVSGI